jgi:hypothetical protein
LEEVVQIADEAELGVIFILQKLMFMVTEGERKIQFYRILSSEDERVSFD